VIAGPTAPTAAFAIGAQADDPVQMYLNDIFTIPANLAGIPALSIPCGFTADGRPIGLQLTGAAFAEARILEVAHRFQQATDWHQKAPPELVA
jgi:aspartyl-tRNA(Asn)/glutamyl-tRNA(Gln) amidotransferase subunit A